MVVLEEEEEKKELQAAQGRIQEFLRGRCGSSSRLAALNEVVKGKQRGCPERVPSEMRMKSSPYPLKKMCE